MRRPGARARTALVLAVLALISLVPGPAGAQTRQARPDVFLKQWDADHDGTLSLDEVKKAAEARFDALDRKHKGKLSRRDLGYTVNGRRFLDADTNKDRAIDRNEYLALVEKLFRAADTDHDGTLDRKKLAAKSARPLLRLFGTRQGPLL
jgi:Ca2+-binding EF-hand superfamily protein